MGPDILREYWYNFEEAELQIFVSQSMQKYYLNLSNYLQCIYFQLGKKDSNMVMMARYHKNRMNLTACSSYLSLTIHLKLKHYHKKLNIF